MKYITILVCIFGLDQLCNAQYEILSAKNGIGYGKTSVSFEPLVDLEDVEYMKKRNFDGIKSFVPKNGTSSTVWFNYIMLFNEYAISSIEVRRDREIAMKFAQEVPDVGKNPCDTFNSSNTAQNTTKDFSCLARTNKMYMVCNVIEKFTELQNETIKLYSTTIAFDRDGTIVAKYRKSHLFDEAGLDAADPEVVTFTTDYGVTFGLLTSVDIMFEFPAMDLVKSNATEILIPYTWSGIMPFLTPLQMQYGWHLSVNKISDINTIFSCYLKPSLGYSGCGTYLSKDGGYQIVMESGDCCDTCTCGSSASTNMTSSVEPKNSQRSLSFSQSYDLSNFTQISLTKTTSPIRAEVCNNDLCCNIEYKFTTVNPNSYYKFIVFSGLMYESDTRARNIQTCGLVACLNDTIESCTTANTPYAINTSFDILKIDGIFQTSLVLPSLLNSQDGLFGSRTTNFQKTFLDSLHYKIELSSTSASINSIQTFGLHSHNIEIIDFPLAEPSSAYTIHGSLILLIFALFTYRIVK